MINFCVAVAVVGSLLFIRLSLFKFVWFIIWSIVEEGGLTIEEFMMSEESWTTFVGKDIFFGMLNDGGRFVYEDWTATDLFKRIYALIIESKDWFKDLCYDWAEDTWVSIFRIYF